MLGIRTMTAEDCIAALEQQRRYLAFLISVKEGKLPGIEYSSETDEEIQFCTEMTAALLARLVYIGRHALAETEKSQLPF